MALRDIFVRFGIDVDGAGKLDATDAAIRRTLTNAERFGGTLKRIAGYLVVGSLVNGIKNFIEEQIRAADALKHNAETLGISTDELQKYQYVSNIMGVSVQQTAVGLRYFNRTIGEAALGTKAAVKATAALGLNIRDAHGDIRPTDELLFDFADKLKNVKSQAVRTAYAMRFLGRGGQALLPALQNGSAELRQWFKDVDELGGGYNEQFVEMAHTTDVQMKRMKMGWRSVAVAIATEVLPVFNRWLERGIKNVKLLIDYAKHTYGFRTALMALASGTVIVALRRLMSLFGIGKTTLGQWMGLLLRNAPLVAFVGLLTAAYLILDDLYTFMQGGDSVIGAFMDSVGGSGTALKFWYDLKKALDDVVTALTPVGSALKDIGKDLLKIFVDSLPSMVQWSGLFLTYVVQAIDGAVSGIKELTMLIGGFFAAVASGKDFSRVMASVWADIDKDNAAFESRGNKYNKLRDAFNEIGNPSSAGSSTKDFVGPLATPTQAAAQKQYEQRAIEVHVTNNIAPGAPREQADAVSRATKGAVKSALSQNRDTHAAVNMGAPQSGF